MLSSGRVAAVELEASMQCAAVRCGVLQCVAVCCGVLQCIAVAVWLLLAQRRDTVCYSVL